MRNVLHLQSVAPSRLRLARALVSPVATAAQTRWGRCPRSERDGRDKGLDPSQGRFCASGGLQHPGPVGSAWSWSGFPLSRSRCGRGLWLPPPPPPPPLPKPADWLAERAHVPPGTSALRCVSSVAKRGCRGDGLRGEHTRSSRTSARARTLFPRCADATDCQALHGSGHSL